MSIAFDPDAAEVCPRDEQLKLVIQAALMSFVGMTALRAGQLLIASGQFPTAPSPSDAPW